MTTSVPFGSLLSKIIDNRGKTCPTSEAGIPLIATNCIKNEHLYPVYEKVRYVSQEVYDSWFRGHPEPGDLIFVLKGTPGRVNWVNNPVDFCIAQDMVALRVDENKVYPKYLFAVLRSSQIQQEIEGLHVGSLIPHFKKSDFDDLQIPLVEEKLQKYIGDVYFNLSLKIDLLHRQNKTLEAMAETLFRQWFIEEAKEDWEECELSEFGHIICGKTPSKSNANYFGNDVPFLKIPDMHGRVFISKTTDNLSQLGALSQSKKMVPQNSICVSCIATVGLVCITDCDLQTNQQINSIVPNELKFLYYLYEVMLDMYDELHNLASGGTATLNLNTGDFSRIKIVKPDDVTLLQFNNAVIPLFTKIRFNGSQIQTLEQLRDMLLPKLMSGEVRVQYQTEEVA